MARIVDFSAEESTARLAGGLVVALAILGGLACAREPRFDHPVLVGRPPEVRMLLPDRMEHALERTGPGFRTYAIAEFDSQIVNVWPGWSYHFDPSQAPFGVIGDFDGDRRWDVALLQRSPKESRFVVVLDRDPVPEVVELKRDPLSPEAMNETLWWFLVRIPPGSIPLPNWDTGTVDSTLELGNDAVEIVYFEKAAVMHYYVDGKFVEVATAD
jgi:hypothetical protein